MLLNSRTLHAREREKGTLPLRGGRRLRGALEETQLLFSVVKVRRLSSGDSHSVN